MMKAQYRSLCMLLLSTRSVAWHSSPLPLFRALRPRAACFPTTAPQFAALSMAAKGGKGLALDKLLQSQGFGTRKDCKEMVKNGYVQVNGEVVQDSNAKIQHEELMPFSVDGEDFEYRSAVYILLNKPAGYECSNKPTMNPGVLELLPDIYMMRGVQPVGRLDCDTTGMLLLSDQGAFNHAITSPRRDKPKVYHVEAKHPVDAAQIRQLLQGVQLKDEKEGETVAAAAVVSLSENVIALTLTQGKYHQVKRMLAAVGNRCERLQRVSIGPVSLGEIGLGDWRHLTDEEVVALKTKNYE